MVWDEGIYKYLNGNAAWLVSKVKETMMAWRRMQPGAPSALRGV